MRIVDKILGVPLSNAFGDFLSGAYRTEDNGREAEHLLLYADLSHRPLPLRINSACYTSDIFGCLRCDCHWQLNNSMEHIARAGAGLIIYHLHHEGRANGLVEKLKTHQIVDAEGLSSKTAYEHLGFPGDSRLYQSSLLILEDLKVDEVSLLTNNPEKSKSLEQGRIKVSSVIPIKSEDRRLEQFYAWKRDDFGHRV